MAYRRLSGGGGDDDDYCYDGDTCPTTYAKDATTVIVQGYIVDRDLPPGRSAVRVPAGILLEAAAKYGAASFTDTDTRPVVVEGPAVPATDLSTPDGETAVTLPVAELLKLAEELTARAA